MEYNEKQGIMYMFCCRLVLILFFWNCSIPVFAEDEAGFDEICRIYTEAKNSSMPQRQSSDYIFENIKKRVSLKNALKAHEAITNLAQADRYKIFRQAAELTFQRSWNCGAMKVLMRP